jgi:chromate transporter
VEAGGVNRLIDHSDRRHSLDVLLAALRLGLTSFGGPIAHLGYFREEYVRRRKWLDDETFSELAALVNVLPGPSSSQLGIAIGTLRAGKLGGLLAWVGFTLPSAVLMIAFAYGVGKADVAGAGWLHGLELAAAAVVGLALVAMARTLTPDLPRLLLAAGALVVALAVGGAPVQVALIAAGAAAGLLVLRDPGRPASVHVRVPVGRPLAVGAIGAFVALFVLLPFAGGRVGGHALESFHAFYRAGALVFGGGHVVLPLLDAAIVGPGWVSQEEFLSGYGAVQAVPGPLFTFGSYLGAVQDPEPNGVVGGLLATGAIFLPSFLLLAGIGPIWGAVRSHPRARSGLAGVGAVVVGLLAAALWDPVLTGAVDSVWDALIVLGLFAALHRVPPWLVVPFAAGLGALLF